VKEQRQKATDGLDADPMREMRERYERAVEADKTNRDLALEDLRFINIPGAQWDEKQRKARRGRPCYEFPILRSHTRQVANDQKKSRPAIKVRALKDATAKDAELRQGIIRNIESTSNADWAYDYAFDLLLAGGFGAWMVEARYSDDDGWDQDLAVEMIPDPLGCVWMDPDAKKPDSSDAKFAFVEESISEEEFKARYPNAKQVDFETLGRQYGEWFTKDHIRIAQYWRLVPVKKTLLLLSNGKTVDKAEVEAVLDEMAGQGITVVRERVCHSHKVMCSVVSGAEELEPETETVFHRIPIVTVYANRYWIDGKWVWCGMVRHSRDTQKLINYNVTTGQEVLAKQHKAVPLVTPKMLEGSGIKELWDSSSAADVPYLPYTPDPAMPQGPTYLIPPPIHAAFASYAQMAIDLLKATDGIFDASVGARTNETSGRAIMARQQEGDTATFDYQDALVKGKQSTGELLDRALDKVYDTPRQVRIIGKDGGEDFVKLYDEVPDEQSGQMVKVNDLSKGKYDVTVSVGASYDTQRMEFVETLTQLGQGNPAIAASLADLMVESMDFPKADEAAERLKLMLPPPIQQALAQKDQSPAVMQLQGQLQQVQQMAEQHIAELNQRLQQAEAKASSKVADELKAAIAQEQLRIDWFKAETDRLAMFQQAAHNNAQLDQAAQAQTFDQITQAQQSAAEADATEGGQ